MTQGWIFQGHFPCSRKVPEAFFLLKGWNCVPLAKGPKFGTDGNFAGSSYSLLHGDEGCAVIVSFQGVDGKRMLTCPWMNCWTPIKKIGFPPEGRVVQFRLRSTIKFFRLLWETLPWSVAQQVVRGWNMLESLNNRTYILCFNYLNMHQVLWCIVYMCLCNFLVGM